jgi:DNA-binding transcriptional LysR family regulator
MNLVFVRYFLALADSGSFTAAAERCHVTQPTLSAGIARLEAELGTRLFDRGRRSALSIAGQRFLPRARAISEEWRLARAEQRSGRRGRLVRVGLASTLPVSAAMRWLQVVQRQLPVDLELSEGAADAIADRWRRGRCDIALYATREANLPDGAVVLWREPYLLAAAIGHIVATRDRWSVNDLAATPFVLRAACEAHDEAQRLFAREGVRPRAVLRSADEERCAAAVLAGLGVSLVPRCLLRPGMASAEVREVALDRQVVMAARSEVDADIVALLRDAAQSATRDRRLDIAR